MIAFWVVCAVEWTQRFLGVIPDPRFWSLIAFVFTVYGGLQIFRLNRRGKRSRGIDPRVNAFRVMSEVFADGKGNFHNVKMLAAGVDNVLVNETGVYAVQVKHRSGSGTIERGRDGEIIFGGRLRDGRLLEAAAHATQPVQELLATHFDNPPIVRPLVVLVGDWTVQPEPGETSVGVVSVDGLPDYFRRQAAALNAEEVDRVSACFRSLAA